MSKIWALSVTLQTKLRGARPEHARTPSPREAVVVTTPDVVISGIAGDIVELWSRRWCLLWSCSGPSGS